MKPDETCDVAVIGSGISGLATALAAQEMGLKPIVFEKAHKLGGGTSFSNGGIWIGNNHLARALGIDDSREAVLEYMRFIAGDQGDYKRITAYVDSGPVALKFFENSGVGFRVTRGFSDHYYDQGPGSIAEGRCLNTLFIAATTLGEWQDSVLMPQDDEIAVNTEELINWGGITNIDKWPKDIIEERRRLKLRAKGVGVITHFVKQLLQRRVSIRLNTPVARLVTDGPRVTGIVTGDGKYIKADRGVMIASGAYESNPVLAQAYEGLPGWRSPFPPTVDGDGMAMAGEIGARILSIHNNLAVFLGFSIPAEKPNQEALFRLVGISEMLCPHTIVVNEEGQRFADESYFQAIVPSLRAYAVKEHRHANLPCFLIFDQQYVEAFSFAGSPRGGEPPPWVARAETVHDLASKLGVNPSGLAATIERFNAFARSGLDEDFARGSSKWSLAKKDDWRPLSSQERYANPSLGALRLAPFYGVELHPTAFASAGILANSSAQVINQRGLPIPGLYVAGNAAAHTEYGVGYQAGFSLGSGMTFGYLAACHMAGAIG